MSRFRRSESTLLDADPVSTLRGSGYSIADHPRGPSLTLSQLIKARVVDPTDELKAVFKSMGRTKTNFIYEEEFGEQRARSYEDEAQR